MTVWSTEGRRLQGKYSESQAAEVGKPRSKCYQSLFPCDEIKAQKVK